MSFESRFFNHYFGDGELVKLANDIDPEFVFGLENTATKEKIDLGIIKEKIGVVKKCYSDLHSFAQGSSYSVIVDFDFVCVEGTAAYFLSLTEQELKKFIAKKRIKEL